MKGQRIDFNRAAELAVVESAVSQKLHPGSQRIYVLNKDVSQLIAGVLRSSETNELECLSINSPPNLVRFASYAYRKEHDKLTDFEKARLAQDFHTEAKGGHIEKAKESGELRDIMGDCDKAIAVGPAVLGWYYKGTFHEVLDDLENAAAALSKAYELGESRAAYGAICDNYLVANRGQAKKSLVKAHRENHLPPDLAKLLGVNLLPPLGDANKALAFLEDGVSLGMDQVLESVLSMHLYNEEIEVQAQRQGIDWRAEIKILGKQVVQKNPKSWRGHAALALFYLSTNRIDDAHANIQKALRLTLHVDASVANIAAQIYMHLYCRQRQEKHKEKSLEYANIAAQLDPLQFENLPAMLLEVME